jgi:hypothetical protein
MSTLPADQRNELQRLLWRSLAVGGVALLVCVIGAPFSPVQFFRAYLAAYQLYLGIALGSLAIFMLYQLTGGAWGFLIRRILEAAMRTLPLLAILFLPVAIGVRFIYPWAQPQQVAGSEELRYNHFYLDVPFWWVRAAIFFTLWLVLSAIFSLWSRQQDRTGEPHLPRKFRLLSAPGLIIYGVTITFASIDWVMSLQPEFHSTMFAPEFATGQLVTAHAFAVVVLAWLVRQPPLANIVSRETLNDVGNMLLTFLVVWAYMAFFEFMLSWIANLPAENAWFIPRSRDGWQWVAWAIFVFHFAVPFFCLLLRNIKRDPRLLSRVAALVFFMHLVFLYFQVMPAVSDVPGVPGTHLNTHWMDFLMPIGIGGIWLAYFLWQLARFPVLPLHDLNRNEAARLRESALEEVAREEALHHG